MHHQTKEILEAMCHHQHLIWASTFHKEQHPKFHNLHNNENTENNKDINKQYATPLK
jgi:hypothetical protein